MSKNKPQSYLATLIDRGTQTFLDVKTIKPKGIIVTSDPDLAGSIRTLVTSKPFIRGVLGSITVWVVITCAQPILIFGCALGVTVLAARFAQSDAGSKLHDKIFGDE